MSPFIIFVFTKVASTTTLVICLLLLFLQLLKSNLKRTALSLLFSSVLLFTVVTATKNYLQAPRPIDALIMTTGYAFPSGHAAGATFLAVIVSSLVWQFTPRFKYIAIIVSILITGLISYSRIFLHVHTWLQVFAGIVFGAFFGFIFIYFGRK